VKLDHLDHREQKLANLDHLESTDTMVKRESLVFVDSREEMESKGAKENPENLDSLASSESRVQTEMLDPQVHAVDQVVLEKTALLDFQVYQDWMDLKVQLVSQVRQESKVPMVNPDEESKELLVKMAFKDALVFQDDKASLVLTE